MELNRTKCVLVFEMHVHSNMFGTVHMFGESLVFVMYAIQVNIRNKNLREKTLTKKYV